MRRAKKSEATPKPRKPAKKAARKLTGRPTKRTPAVVRKVLEGLAKGTPLTIICEPDNMPCDDTVREWAKQDPALSRDIARAREAGYDRIALDALAIADQVTDKDTIETKFGAIPNKEWLMRSKLRVETRLKLLAKWDPKRYSDKVQTEISGPDGKPIKSETSHQVSAEMQEEILRRTAEASAIAARVQAPASFRGHGSEE